MEKLENWKTCGILVRPSKLNTRANVSLLYAFVMQITPNETCIVVVALSRMNQMRAHLSDFKSLAAKDPIGQSINQSASRCPSNGTAHRPCNG